MNEFVRKIKSLFRNIKKYGYCSWSHKEHRCYPRDPNGYWHCTKCHPCMEIFDIIKKQIEKEKKRSEKK